VRLRHSGYAHTRANANRIVRRLRAMTRW
jgi:hypothetical protein